MATVAGVLVMLASCSDDDSDVAATAPVVTSEPADASTTVTSTAPSSTATSEPPAQETTAGGSTTVASSGAIDACALAEEGDLTGTFPAGPPAPEGNDYGAGFSDCAWEDDTAEVLISIVPAGNFQTDFLDQLNVTGPAGVPELGDDAVTFPGLVGIGRASGRGASVGFTSGASGVIVAVRGVEDDPELDLASATELAITVAQRL